MTKRAAVRRWNEALARREQLATEVEGLTEQLQSLEAEERRVLEVRGGLEAVRRAQEATSAARAMLEQAQAELGDLDSRIPELEAASDRADLLTDMATSATAAQEAGGRVYSILRGILERESEALEALAQAHAELDTAAFRYDALGRLAVPGRDDMRGESHWEKRTPERVSLEGEIRRGGVSLKAVLGDLEPENQDPLYKLVWGVYWTVRARHRTKLQREKEEARQEAAREAQREREKRHYGVDRYAY